MTKAVVMSCGSSLAHIYSLTYRGRRSQRMLELSFSLFNWGVTVARDMPCIGTFGAYMQVIAVGCGVGTTTFLPSSTAGILFDFGVRRMA